MWFNQTGNINAYIINIINIYYKQFFFFFFFSLKRLVRDKYTCQKNNNIVLSAKKNKNALCILNTDNL